MASKKATAATVVIDDYKILNRDQSEVLLNARLGLTLQGEITRLTSQMDEIKQFFRQRADGEKLEVTLEGVGSVTVKKPAAAASGTSIEFDEDAFNKLPKSTRKALIDTGVVKVVGWTRPESKAAVTFTLNV